MAGTGWTCSNAACTRSDPLAVPSSYPVITVTVSVAANAASSLTNMAMVSGGGSPSNSASDVTAIAPAPPPAAVTIFSPAQGATGVSLTPTLTWIAATGATSYDVYFGTASVPPLVTNTTGTSYSPTLTASTTYYWFLVSKNASGSAPSAVWSFTTAAPPPPSPVIVFSPAQGATGVSLAPTLTWTAATGATSYDVYFGTAAMPPFVTNTTGTSYSPTGLSANTTYYWYLVSKNTSGSTSSAIWSFTTEASSHPAFFTGEASLGSGVYYLQFQDKTVFGYYNYVASSIFYHYDLGYEAFIPGSASDLYLYDFTSSHWWYTSSTLFPYFYDFTLNTWIYYFPNTTDPGHYTSDPRYFSNLTTGKTFTM
jgi:hypothetical protein